MPGDLIKEKHSYAPPEGFTIANPLDFHGHAPHVFQDRYSSTIASCEQYPPSIYAAQLFATKPLFVEPEEEIGSIPAQQSNQQSQKESFLKRISWTNLKVQATSLATKVKDTLGSWKSQIWGFFGWKKSSVKNESSKKMETSKQNKSEALQEERFVSTIGEVREKKRIKEIEEALEVYNTELQATGRGNVNSLIEMICKINILCNGFQYGSNKRVMQNYMKLIENNLQERLKTYRNGHWYSYAAAGLHFASAGMSVVSVFGVSKSAVSTVLKGLGAAAGPVSQSGQALSRVGEARGEITKQLPRTEKEARDQQFKEVRQNANSDNDRLISSRDQTSALWRELWRNHSEAVKRAIN